MVNSLIISFFDRSLTPLYASYQIQTYFSVVLFILLAAALCAILASLAYVLSLSPLQDSEKKSEYECGFEPFDNATRLPFDVHFYLVGILFLIFDVEVALFFPWVLSLRLSGWFGFYLIVVFVFVLTIGFLYEWKRGALIWPSRQTELPYLSTNEKNTTIKIGFVPTIFLTELPSYAEQFINGLLPEIFLITAISAILTFLSYGLGQHQNRKHLALSALTSISEALLFTALLYTVQLFLASSAVMFNGYIAITAYISFIKLLTTLCCWFILFSSESYVKSHTSDLLEYSVIISLATLLILLIVGASHFVSAFISLVGFSLNLYVLIFSDAATAAVREGGVKYFYLSTLSSGIILYGIFLFYFISQTGQFFEINQLFSTDFELTVNSSILVKAAVVFVLIGLFFKLSAFPGHLWAADVYEGSPDPITAFFMLPVKIATLAFVLNVLIAAFEPLAAVWQPLMLVSSFFSLIWGCFAALSERKTKRFLAFASINQIGFILIGLATASFEGYRASIFYIIIYAIINLIFLTIFLQAKRSDGRSIIYLTDFRGFGQKYPTYSWSTAVVLLSIAGIPPLAGFFGKYYLLLHAQEQGLYIIVIAALFTSLISTYYYLRIIKIIWFENALTNTSVVCELSKFKAVILYAAEWSLWGFILYVSGALQIIDLLITSAIVVG